MLFDKHITLFQCIALFSLTVIASGRLSPETAAKAREVNKQMSNQSNSKNVIKTLTEFRAGSHDAYEVTVSSHMPLPSSPLFSPLFLFQK